MTKSEVSPGAPGEAGQIHFLPGVQSELQRVPQAAGLTQNFSSSWIITAAEAVAIVALSVACGLVYHQWEYGAVPNPVMFVSTGLVVALLYCVGTRSIAELFTSRVAILSYAYLMWTGVFLVLSFFAFSIKAGEALSRGAILSFYGVGFVGVVTTRLATARIVARFRGQVSGRDCMVIGAAASTQPANVARNLRIAGHGSASVFTIDNSLGERDWSESLVALMRQVLGKARNGGHGEIYVVAAGLAPTRLHALLAALQTVPRAVRLVPDHDIERLLSFPLRRVGRSWVVELQRAPLSGGQRLIKRALDLAISAPLLVFLMPLMLVVAALVKLDSPGPVFFCQTRNGAWGVPFRIIKFRTMNVMEDGSRIVQAQREDVRVTRLGRVLRKTSLDELPQLINVVKGEMSLVGPRPHAVAHDKFYGSLIENYELRQLVKPGITGWAQVNGYRGETATTELMRKRVEHDLWYAKNTNPVLDVMILAKTAFVVFGRPEAY